jgi:hypothetical protein
MRAKEEDMLFAQPLSAETRASSGSAPSASEWLKSIGQRVSAWASACADYYSAATLYDELRGLSDAELRRRGLSRDTLARDVCQSCDTLGGR